jgi:hypothetical protein
VFENGSTRPLALQGPSPTSHAQPGLLDIHCPPSVSIPSSHSATPAPPRPPSLSGDASGRSYPAPSPVSPAVGEAAVAKARSGPPRGQVRSRFSPPLLLPSLDLRTARPPPIAEPGLRYRRRFGAQASFVRAFTCGSLPDLCCFLADSSRIGLEAVWCWWWLTGYLDQSLLVVCCR